MAAGGSVGAGVGGSVAAGAEETIGGFGVVGTGVKEAAGTSLGAFVLFGFALLFAFLSFLSFFLSFGFFVGFGVAYTTESGSSTSTLVSGLLLSYISFKVTP